MVGKKHEMDIFFCDNCPDFKEFFWENLFKHTWGGSGFCAKGNFKIYDSSKAIPKDCPLKGL